MEGLLNRSLFTLEKCKLRIKCSFIHFNAMKMGGRQISFGGLSISHFVSLFWEYSYVCTTYRANKYDIHFAPFTRLNHHLQSIQFGCALLQYETKVTFIRLFETWLEAMGWCHPGLIITNQDLAMKARQLQKFFQPLVIVYVFGILRRNLWTNCHMCTMWNQNLRLRWKSAFY